jgi:tetratricopeptide (TPR) repeat protein
VKKISTRSEHRTADSRTGRLEEAWGLGIQGSYEAALEILESLLEQNHLDLGSLRLKGNLLELKEMDRLEFSSKKLIASTDYVAARGCYEKILRIDPGNVKARIDLGDHYRNLDANDKALEHYSAAVKALQQTPRDGTWKEDVQELLKAVALLTKHARLGTQAKSLEAWCLRAIGAFD